MRLELVVEVLDLLMRPPTDWTGDTPTGASNDVYYITATRRKDVWKYMIFARHDFDRVQQHPFCAS